LGPFVAMWVARVGSSMQRATGGQFAFPLTAPSRVPLSERVYFNGRADVSRYTEPTCVRNSGRDKNKCCRLWKLGYDLAGNPSSLFFL